MNQRSARNANNPGDLQKRIVEGFGCGGVDLNHSDVLIMRKLLILNTATIARNAPLAKIQDTDRTQTLPPSPSLSAGTVGHVIFVLGARWDAICAARSVAAAPWHHSVLASD